MHCTSLSLCVYRETFPLSVYNAVEKIYIQNNNNNNTAYDEFKNEHIQVYYMCSKYITQYMYMNIKRKTVTRAPVVI